MMGVKCSGGLASLLGFGRGTNGKYFISAGKYPVSAISLNMSAMSLFISLGPNFSSSALMLSTLAFFPSFNTVIALSTSLLVKGVFILHGFMFSITIYIFVEHFWRKT